jgi:hypothetical protein
MTASHNTELPRQRVEEWLEGCDWDFHEKQFKTPYRLTVHFLNWLLGLGCLKSKQPLRIGDIGAGMGAVIHYFGKHCRDAEFVGLEINPECVRRGNERLAALGAKNCRLEVFNLYDSYPRPEPHFDGLMSCALLSWLPDLKEALKKITALNPGWIAASSLFYDGPVDCIIETRDGSRPLASAAYTKKFYNIYSLETTREILTELGYAEFQSTPFQIDIDLAQPAAKGMGTYTEKTSDGRRLQISGPLLMPWHFIFARKK